MASAIFEPDDEFTLDRWIKEGKNLDISQDKLCLKDRVGDVIIPYQTLICRYYHTLLPFTSVRELTQEEYLKYKNNPKLLSQDLYGTPELWSAIMYINNIVSIADFKKQKLRLFHTSIISKLEELMVLAEEELQENKEIIAKNQGRRGVC